MLEPQRSSSNRVSDYAAAVKIHVGVFHFSLGEYAAHVQW